MVYGTNCGREEQIENTTPVGSLIRLEMTVKFAGHSSLKRGCQPVTPRWKTGCRYENWVAAY